MLSDTFSVMYNTLDYDLQIYLLIVKKLILPEFESNKAVLHRYGRNGIKMYAILANIIFLVNLLYTLIVYYHNAPGTTLCRFFYRFFLIYNVYYTYMCVCVCMYFIVYIIFTVPIVISDRHVSSSKSLFAKITATTQSPAAKAVRIDNNTYAQTLTRVATGQR